MNIIKHKKVAERFQMVSLDVSNYLLICHQKQQQTIFRRIYTKHDLTKLTKKEMKELPLLCTFHLERTILHSSR